LSEISTKLQQRVQLIIKTAGMLPGTSPASSSVDIADNVSSPAAHNTTNAQLHTSTTITITIIVNSKKY